MSHFEQFPAVRLAVAGYASLALLAWIDFVPGCLPPIFSRLGRVSPGAVLVTATISLFILVILAPVLIHGPQGNRWLAVLTMVFPLLTFGVTGLWLGAWAVFG